MRIKDIVEKYGDIFYENYWHDAIKVLIFFEESKDEEEFFNTLKEEIIPYMTEVVLRNRIYHCYRDLTKWRNQNAAV